MRLVIFCFIGFVLAILPDRCVHSYEDIDDANDNNNGDLDQFFDNYAQYQLYKEWLNAFERDQIDSQDNEEKRVEELLVENLDNNDENNDIDVSDDTDDIDNFENQLFGEINDQDTDIESEKRIFGSIFGKKTTKTTKTTATTTVASNIANDAFYILKRRCEVDPFDAICRQKKKEMYDLVERCDDLTKRKGETIPACKEIVSLYCYVFKRQDLFTCALTSYDEYIPGRKTSAAPTTTRYVITTIPTRSTTTPTTTRSTTTSTTTRSTTTPTTTRSTTTAARITTAPSKPNTVAPVTQPPSPGSSTYPFNKIPGFTGTITSIPKDTALLKEIGQYCLKLKTKDKNCDALLVLLKNQFKSCEKKPISDVECQTFKKQFCTAYPNFNCCSEVLAGRTCKSNQVQKRTEKIVNILRSLLDD